MLEGLENVSWESLPQPQWNKPDEVPQALRALASATKEPSARDAYNRVLYALGNNHAGNYYPVVLAAVPFLGQLLKREVLLPRVTTLDILIDLVGSFGPAPGFETIESPPPPRPLSLALREAVFELRPTVVALLETAEIGPRERKLGHELLELLDEPSVPEKA